MFVQIQTSQTGDQLYSIIPPMVSVLCLGELPRVTWSLHIQQNPDLFAFKQNFTGLLKMV